MNKLLKVKAFSRGVYMLIAFAVIAALPSCIPTKKMIYLQAAEELADSFDTTMHTYAIPEYRLQVNDIIDIQIKTLDPEFARIFNPDMSAAQAMNTGVQSGGDMYYMNGYTINDSGNVKVPIIGEVQVVGLTIKEAEKIIHTAFLEFFKQGKFYLTVKLGGIRFSALGEFNRPGKYTILQNQLTIFEAIASAGDLNMVAKRDGVKLIRQYPSGTKIHHVNLLDQSIIASPFYFIQPNDVIYVEPLKQKSYGVGTQGAQSLTLILSLVTSTLIILTYFQN